MIENELGTRAFVCPNARKEKCIGTLKQEFFGCLAMVAVVSFSGAVLGTKLKDRIILWCWFMMQS